MSKTPMHELLPWHRPIHDKLLHAFQRKRLPHALLFSGPPGMGKARLAERFAHTLLCEHPAAHDGMPCGQCKSCLLLRAGNHPDLRKLATEGPGKQIKVDQVRELAGFCALTASYGRWQVVIIDPAEAMNIYAANSLLKLLEEPPAETLLLLLSHRPAQLLATIRSRCRRFDFTRGDLPAARQWLQAHLKKSDADVDLLLALADQAPLAALQLAEKLPKRQALFDSLQGLLQGREDPLEIAAQWVSLGAADSLAWLISWGQDLARCIAGGERMTNTDLGPALRALAQRLDSRSVFKLLDREQEAVRLLQSTANIREQGIMENVVLAWLALGAYARGA